MKKLAKRKVSKIKQKPVRRRNPTAREVNDAIKDLLWPHDGPVSYWSVLSQAIELSAERKYSPEVLSNAVYSIIDIDWNELLSTSNS